jgi:NADPH:quinone reductase-like Zn-dependent oxidoreductase
MANQEKNRVCRRTGTGINAYHIYEEAIPAVKPGYVIVCIHAISLNYKDIMLSSGQAMRPKENGIPVSDGMHFALYLMVFILIYFRCW